MYPLYALLSFSCWSFFNDLFSREFYVLTISNTYYTDNKTPVQPKSKQTRMKKEEKSQITESMEAALMRLKSTWDLCRANTDLCRKVTLKMFLKEHKKNSCLLITYFMRGTVDSLIYPSVQFSHSVVSDALQPHWLQQTRPPCPSLTPGVYSNSCPLSQWCHPTISSSVVPFSSHLQSFPASGYFLVSQFFPSGGQSIGVSASASVLPMNIQNWFPLGLTGWISLQSKEHSGVHNSSKASILWHSAFFMVQLSHPYMTICSDFGAPP